MLKIVGIFISVAVAAVLILASGQPDTFTYERSGLVSASPEEIFPYLNDLKKGSEWSPFEKADPEIKKTYSGAESGPGAVMEFSGNSDVGAGKIEILQEESNSMVKLRLDMTQPMSASNIITYRLTPEEDETRFTWSMSGNNPLLGKIISIFIDCEKMVGEQFENGIENLKAIVETTPEA